MRNEVNNVVQDGAFAAKAAPSSTNLALATGRYGKDAQTLLRHGSKRLQLKMCEIDNGNFID